MPELDIFKYIDSILTKDYIDQKIRNKELFGVSAKEVADHFNLYRSSVSLQLNDAVKNGSYIKIDTRPVLFVPISILEKELNFTPSKSIYSPEEFKKLIFLDNEQESNPFSAIIGYNGSQKLQVKQAQSAILYPPKGLHTLITGESGTGKTLFARTMYNYGRITKKLSVEEYPFIEFNCADYYHNPQLLLSQLFGHIKGAFTGADQETSGLVEKANHGILFLDEIHRLPPEGQELLFYLMDTGQYRKMGEASTIRKAEILIIGATTENPNDVLLKTFKRRIPLTIQLPPLRERPIIEKLKILELLFSKEAMITQRTYIVDAEIVKAITIFDFPENIGQLASEIKILCARSFLENSSEDSIEINVPFEYLSDKIKQVYYSRRNKNLVFTDELENYNYDLVISPSHEISYLKESIVNEKIYDDLIQEIRTYSEQGLTSGEVAKNISSAVSSYYQDIIRKMYFKTINRQEIYKIIDKDIVDFSVDMMKEIQHRLYVDITEQNILILAFHLKFLIDRLKKINYHEQSTSSTKIGDDVVDEMILKIEKRFNVNLPTDEKNFFQLLIKNISENEEANPSQKAMLYIIAHGNTASSIADVCNKLLHTDYVKAFDMPLSQDVQQSYQLFVQEAKKLQPKNGIMILADMGSLLDFGPKLTRDTGIPTHTIPNVTTAIALDFAHIMLNRNEHIDITYNEYLIKNKLEPALAESKKSMAIISACSSGRGTSIAFQNTIEKTLKSAHFDNIKVFALNNAEIQNRDQKFQSIVENYNVIAIVGNIHIDINIPFFHITELISKEKKNNFISFLNNTLQYEKDDSNSNNIMTNTKSETVNFLAQHVMYVNPVAVQKVCTEYLDSLFEDLQYRTKDINSIRFSLIIHLGFMIERIIAKKHILFDYKEDFMNQNQSIITKVRKHIFIIEDAFEININDDEICYLVVTLYPKSYDSIKHC